MPSFPPQPDQQLIITQHWEFPEYLWPVQLRFAPNTDHVMVVFKQGFLRLYPNIDAGVDEYLAEFDLNGGLPAGQGEVYPSFDHGLTSFQFDLEFPAVPKGYILYSAQPGAVETPWPQALFDKNRPDKWNYYVCPNLNAPAGDGSYLPGSAANPGNREGQFCEHYGRVARVGFSADLATIVKEANLLTGQCGGSSTHGTGNLEFLADGRLTLTTGDNALWTETDPGSQYEDACFIPGQGMPQGSWRSQRLEDPFFMHGKMLGLTPANYRTGQDLQLTKAYQTLVVGLRNPFRTFVAPNGDMYVGDVGMGGGAKTERLFQFQNVGAAGQPIPNGGWPCNEGVQPQPWEAFDDAARRTYTQDNNLPICDPVITAIEEGLNAPGADKNWKPPIYEYRTGENDPLNGGCVINYGSITGVMLYEGQALGPKYEGGLFFADHTQKCMWFWPAGQHPEPPAGGWVTGGVGPWGQAPGSYPQGILPQPPNPTLVVRYNGFVDIAADPVTGIIYVADSYPTTRRIVSIQASDVIIPTKPPVELPPEPNVEPLDVCHDPFNMPEVTWEVAPDGAFEATITMTVGEYETEYGTVRTRAYNGLMPGPTMKMKACGVYRVTLVNGMEEWEGLFPPPGVMNRYRDPGVTNLHLHGMHISGADPGDNQLIEIGPGEEYEHIYVIPCDHSAGTHWYHAHHHGSVTLQAGGGAAAMLIVEDALENGGIEAGMPVELQNLPEAQIFFQEVSPAALNAAKVTAKDPIWETSAENDFFLINGCDTSFDLKLPAGEWTRLRILQQSTTKDSTVNLFEKLNAAAPDCEVGVLAKDGVYLETVPRWLDPALPYMHFSISSRVDVVVKCPVSAGGFKYAITLEQEQEEPVQLGTVTITPAKVKDAVDIPDWTPCRPWYLMDLRVLPENEAPGEAFAITVRNDINGNLYNPEIFLIDDLEAGKVYEWVIDGSADHPFHSHINHMQYLTKPANFDKTPNWSMPGDWMDTISVPQGVARVRFVTDRFAGPSLLHCHIYPHSDTGVMATNLIHNGFGPLAGPATLQLGTCPLPRPRPLNGVASPIPGVLEAASFDLGGLFVGYHTQAEPDWVDAFEPYDPRPLNSNRMDSALYIALTADGNGGDHDILDLVAGDWMTYTVNVSKAGAYTAGLRLAGQGPSYNLALKVDNSDCASAEGIVTAWKNDAWPGTGGVYESFLMDVDLPKGEHTLTLCVLDGGDGVSISALSFLSAAGDQIPYLGTPLALPGTLQAELYDVNGAVDVTKKPPATDFRVKEAAQVTALGGYLMVSSVESGESLSYTVNVKQSGKYDVSLIISSTEPAAVKAKGLAMHAVVDSNDCKANQDWGFDAPAFQGSGLAGAPALYTPAAGKMTLSAGLHRITFCFDRVPEDLEVDGMTISNKPVTSIPFQGEPTPVPGTILAVEYDKPVVGFSGEGSAYHNLDIFGVENELRAQGGPETIAAAGSYVQYIVGSEWLRYTVQFTGVGAHHAVVDVASLPVESVFNWSILLDSVDCLDANAALFISEDDMFMGTGGFEQFAPYAALPAFQVTAAMLEEPHILTLCFNNVPATGLQVQAISVVKGPSPGKKLRGCYIEACNPLPIAMPAENFDTGGSGIAYYNLPVDDAPVVSMRAGGPEIELIQGANMVTHIINGEWLSYTVLFTEGPGNYQATLAVGGTVGSAGGLALHMVLDTVDCAQPAILTLDNAAWGGGAVAPLAIPGNFPVGNALLAGEHIITICFDRIFDGTGGIFLDEIVFELA
jgi:suppressor of ftsI